MSIERKDVVKVSLLARLSLSEEELDRMTQQLGQIVGYVDQLAEQYKGKIKVGKVDKEVSPNTAVQLGIASIPTLMVFKGGKIVSQIVGARGSAAALAKDLRIEDVLKA